MTWTPLPYHQGVTGAPAIGSVRPTPHPGASNAT